ncbi:diacylglycerol/lipid kinase family protein [Spirochaetota bacterium]
MKKALVIYNPVAGWKKITDIPKNIMISLAKNKYQYEWFETSPKGIRGIDRVLKNRYDRIIVAGGDGTVSHVAAYLIKHRKKTPIGIVPLGTANLVAGSLNIPLIDVRRAVNLSIREKPKPFDVLLVNKRHVSLVGVGQGYDTIFIKGATRPLKRKYGFIAYIISFLKTFFFYRSKKYTLVIDNKKYEVYAKLVLALNSLSLPYTLIGKHISPQDGLVNIAVFNPRSIYGLFIMLIQFFLRLPRAKKPKFKDFTAKKITIQQKGTNKFQIDGEVMKGKKVEVKILPKALNIVFKKKF